MLVPTRELATQVLGVAKGLSHYAKVTACLRAISCMCPEAYSRDHTSLLACFPLVSGPLGDTVFLLQGRGWG